MNYSALLQIARPNPSARLRLVCFSYAGGNANHYLGWQAQLHAEVELVVCQLPGRGVRLFESPYDSMSPLVKDLCHAITELCDKPLLFFGHSMGAKVAYELGLAMQERKLPLPLHMVISASAAPFQRRTGTIIHTLDDSDFIAAVARLKGTPSQILRNAELMSLCLPSLRADYKLLETYCNCSRQRLASRLTLLGGSTDSCVSAEELSEWAPLFEHVVEAHWLEGGHFFINESSDELLEFLNESVVQFNLNLLDNRLPYYDIAL